MSAVRNTDRMLKIMAYADGELEGAERDEVEAWIAEDGASVRFANELAGLGDLVKLGFDHSKDSKTIASFDIADAVMAQVAKTTNEKNARDEEKKASASSSTSKSSPASAASASAAAPVISLEAARARRNTRVGIVVAAALAVAASVFMVMKDKGAEQPMARTQPATEVSPATNPSPAMTVAANNPSANAPNGANGTVEVNVEQTPGSSVSVFYVPSETESLSTSVVVWVDDQGGK